ncbi:hypothetical protein FB451DRAFT_1184463 [Mycena latifolia]|nr:hypothetical protein FB451DRAFT_1184463 [Mycena latifolia]
MFCVPLSALRSDCPSSRQVLLVGGVYQSILKRSGSCPLRNLSRSQESKKCARCNLHQRISLEVSEGVHKMHSYYSPRFALLLESVRLYLSHFLDYSSSSRTELMAPWRSEAMHEMYPNHSLHLSPAPELRWRAPTGVSRDICVRTSECTLREPRLWEALHAMYMDLVLPTAPPTRSLPTLVRRVFRLECAALLAAVTLYCGFTARPCLVTRGRTVPDLHQGLIRRVRLGVPRNAQIPMHGRSEGCRSAARTQRRRKDATPSARMAGRAREDLISGIAMGRNTWPDLKFAPDAFLEESTLGGQDSCEVRCVRDVSRTRAGRRAAVLTRCLFGATGIAASKNALSIQERGLARGAGAVLERRIPCLTAK